MMSIIVMVVVVVVWEMKMYIVVERNLCWFHPQTRTRMTTEFLVGNSRSSSCPIYTVY